MSNTPTTRVTYGDDDVLQLLDLIERHRDHLLTKERDSTTLTLRKQAWISVTDSYNSTRSGKETRTDSQLIKKWENLVFSTKTAEAAVKQSRRTTGGGEGVADLTITEKRVTGILAGLHQPFSNNFDGDAGHHEGMERERGGARTTNREKDDGGTAVAVYQDSASASQYMMSKTTRKRQQQQPQMTQAEEEMMTMRREEHEMNRKEHELRMHVLHVQEQYWIEKRRRLSINTVLPESPSPSPFLPVTEGNDGQTFFGQNFTML
jgi:hypothetical protein